MLTPEEKKHLDVLMGQVTKVNFILHSHKIEMWAGFKDKNCKAVNIQIFDRKPEYMQSFIEKNDCVYNLVSKYDAPNLKEAIKMYPSKMVEGIEKINDELRDYTIDMCYGDEESLKDRVKRILKSIASLEADLDMKIFDTKEKSVSHSLKLNSKSQNNTKNLKDNSMEL